MDQPRDPRNPGQDGAAAVDEPVVRVGGRSPSTLSTGCASTAAAEAPGTGPLALGQRWSVARKRAVVLRLLGGESMELLSRELGVPRPAHRLGTALDPGGGRAETAPEGRRGRGRKVMSIKSEVEAANATYAADFGDKARLALPPARSFLILTCMDARLDPAKYAGLAEGDAHVVRNAGGRATDDAIRSLVISHKLLGTREWFVVQHTDCGMLYFDDTTMGDLLAGSLETAELTPQGFRNASNPGGSAEGRYIKWHTIADQQLAVIEDVTRIRNHPLVDPAVPIYGYVYDVNTGRLNEVAAATQAGRPLR